MAEISDLGNIGPARSVRRVGIVLLLGAALGLGACGGGSDDTASSVAPTVSPVSDVEAPPEADPGSQEVEDDPDEDVEGSVPSGLAEQRAVVVIGEEQFEFEMSAGCVSIGGAVGGSGLTADGAVRIEIDIPPEDWETSADGWDAPSIRVYDERDDGDRPDWRAGGEVIANYEGLSGVARVETFSVEGGRAFGSATFIDLRAYDLAAVLEDPQPDPASGTFEINCG